MFCKSKGKLTTYYIYCMALCQMSPQTPAGRPVAGGPPPMLKKLTGAGKTSAVGVQRRATISQASERLSEITNTTPASQTPTQELKRYALAVAGMSVLCRPVVAAC